MCVCLSVCQFYVNVSDKTPHTPHALYALMIKGAEADWYLDVASMCDEAMKQIVQIVGEENYNTASE